MKRLFTILTLGALVAGSGCYRHDIRTITVSVPSMSSQDCAKPVQEALARVEGIISVTPDFQKRSVDVKYNALKMGIKNIEYVIANAGFKAGETPANAEARAKLPIGCKDE